MQTALLSSLFMKTTTDLIFLFKIEGHGLESLLFDSANPAYFKQMGIPSSLIGRPVNELLSLEASDLLFSYISKALETRQAVKYEENIINSEKQSIVETTLLPFFDDAEQPTYLLGVTRDVTEKKMAERKVQESQQRYRSLFEHNPNAIFSINAQGYFEEVNDRVREITGYERFELLREPFHVVIAPKSMHMATESFAMLLQGIPSNLELTLLHKDGHEVEVHVMASPSFFNGEVVGLIGIAQDMTASRKAEQRMKESEERYRVLVQQSPDSVVIHDEGSIIFFNEAAIRLLGINRAEDLSEKKLTNFIHPDQQRHVDILLRRSNNYTNEFPPFETRIVKMNGDVVDVEGTSVYIEYNGKRVHQIILRDITRRKIEEEKLHKLSHIDGLTNIGNRRMFDAAFAREINRSKRNRTPISLILFDIDYFKAYNDHYGHLMGDQCLQLIAHAAASITQRSADVVARFGGEEFAVLLPETDLAGAVSVAKRLHREIENLSIPHAKSLLKPAITISIGVASVLPDLGFQSKEMIEAADKALYAAKNKGKNRIEVGPHP